MKTTVDLHEVLKKYNESNFSLEEDLVLKEAQKILSSNESSELRTLELAGLGKNIEKANSIRAKRNQEMQFDEVYDISAIKKLAINYRLRLLRSYLYKGNIDPLLPSLLDKFVKKNNIQKKYIHHSYSYNEGYDLYILAPAESFNLQERPKDPLIFYKINNEKYALIHKWGNDLSLFRKVKYFFLRSPLHLFILPILLLAANFFLQSNLLSIITGVVFPIVIVTTIVSHVENLLFSKYVWNSPFNE